LICQFDSQIGQPDIRIACLKVDCEREDEDTVTEGDEKHREKVAGPSACTAATGLAEAALAAAGISICHVDTDRILNFDGTAQVMFDVPAESSFVKMLAGVGRSHRRDVLAMIRAAGGLSQQLSAEFPFSSPNGRQYWVRAIARRMTEHCAQDCAFITLLDVTADRQANEELRLSEEHLRYTVEYNPQLPWIADPAGNIIDLTDRWLAATGMSRETALGEGWAAVTHPDDIGLVNEKITQALMTGEPFNVRMRLCVGGTYRWMRAQGYPRRDASGNIVRWYGYTEDIHEHVLVEDQIRWNAEHDPLTGLYNRVLFNAQLTQSLEKALQSLRRLGVLLVDIDHFKEVNDQLGHHAGDALLRHYADRLRATLPPEAIIARLGGDEFAVLFPDVRDHHELTAWAEQILHLHQPIDFEGRSIDCHSSIGAAMFPEHGTHASELLRHADVALYAAKEAGRANALVFEATMQDEVRERTAMVNRARTAAKEGDILAFYQPKVSLETGDLIGFEALLRWRDAAGRIHAPASIMAAFEDREVADMLGQTMLDHVIADITRWRAMGLAYGSVAINAAPAEFRQTNFAPRLIKCMEDAGLSASDIEVEITEGVFLGRRSDHTRNAIAMLDEFGTRIVLDDFGTGFASLTHLRALPVDTLKIDRSFISDITKFSGDAAIVSAIINLGRNLGIKVVAEGLETIEQVETLRDFGCEQAQGYYFGVPTPAMKIPELIRAWTGRAPLLSNQFPLAVAS
jgi:diguanylate cyclase (GGDEF)-like protein/PAS domain S-box-containing protein